MPSWSTSWSTSEKPVQRQSRVDESSSATGGTRGRRRRERGLRLLQRDVQCQSAGSFGPQGGARWAHLRGQWVVGAGRHQGRVRRRPTPHQQERLGGGGAPGSRPGAHGTVSGGAGSAE